MLSPQHRDIVLLALAQHLADKGPFYAVLATEIRPLVEPQAQQAYLTAIYSLEKPNSPSTAAALTLELLERQSPPGPQPQLLPRYLESLADGAFPNLGPIVNKLREELNDLGGVLPIGGPDPFETFLIFRQQPFLNRRPLRPKLRQLLFIENGPSVLTVSGPRRSGKTYTTALLEHVRREQQRFQLISPVELGGEALSPEDVARSLVARMFRRTDSMPTPGPEMRNSYLSRLAEWVVQEALATKGRWCLVLDGANDEGLLGDTETLIHHLAKLTQTGPAYEWLRLVVLDYEDPFLDLWTSSVDRDKLEPPDHIGQVDVEDYFNELAASLGQKVDHDKVQDHAQAVIARCPTGGSDRMQALYDAVEDETLAFLS